MKLPFAHLFTCFSECSDSEKSEKEEDLQESDEGSECCESKGEPKEFVSRSREKAVVSRLGSGDGVLPPAAWPIRESMFPHIPPYLNFNLHDADVPFNIPAGSRKYFKWKLSTITPIVVRKTLTNSGFRLVRSEFSTGLHPFFPLMSVSF